MNYLKIIFFLNNSIFQLGRFDLSNQIAICSVILCSSTACRKYSHKTLKRAHNIFQVLSRLFLKKCLFVNLDFFNYHIFPKYCKCLICNMKMFHFNFGIFPSSNLHVCFVLFILPVHNISIL